jgi:transketolase C-terminal domain/subunit
MNQYEAVIFAEEGSRSGGFGEYASDLARRRNCSSTILVLGIREQFDALGKREELFSRNNLDAEGIAEAALEGIREKS